MTTRRSFMTILGGGIVVAAAGGAFWANTREPVGARRPWSEAGKDADDIRRTALSFAVLAPNPHNRQPWVADLAEPGQITLFCQADRRLPETDPFDRQITIGLGCFLELLAQAAAEHGYSADIVLFPDGEPQPRLDARPVARIRLEPDARAARDPLFAQVLARRSNKEPYDTGRAVTDADLGQIAAATRTVRLAGTTDAVRVAALRDMAWQANYTEITTPRTLKESIDLMRIGRREIEANPDGIDLSGPFIEALALTGMLTRDAMMDPGSDAFAQQISILKAPFDTAMAFQWMTTAGNGRNEQIAAGRDYVRLNLAATAAGLSMHPFSQALQEFPEMRPHVRALRNALAIPDGETLQMVVRLGYGPDARPAPRWPYETRIRT